MKAVLEFLVGLFTGILSGFGIGGGSLLILYLTGVAGASQYAAGGINLLYFLFCAPAALISHIKNRLIDKQTVIWCTAAGTATSLLAAWVAGMMEVELLRRIFGVFLLYIGVRELRAKPAEAEEESEGGRDREGSAPVR
ncbi:MAG TPA: sulfite exporter TauE/SafE family protein [Firmicutes bacterium]|nr:sulfite exporter TauE/SafE family protein [Bacillota bacterium]